MLSSRKTNSLVGLDIQAGSIAATEVRVNGHDTVAATAIRPLEPGIFGEGEVADSAALAATLRELFSDYKLSKKVRLGIANQRVVVRTVRLPAIEDPKEMEAAIRFQAQEQIPMPLEQAVLDHQIVGAAPGEGDGPPQVDVVVVAARRDMIDAFLAPLRGAGLQPVGIDLSAFGLIRSLSASSESAVAPAGGNGEGLEEGAAPTPSATLFCNIGDVTNLAVARGTACLFTRVSQFGLEALAQRLSEDVSLTLEHARQWLVHVGLEAPVDAVQGDRDVVTAARDVLEESASALLNELRLSLEYYGAQEGAPPVERIVLCGPGSTIHGLAGTLERGLGLPFQSGRPVALAGLDDATAARLTLSYGLALER